MSTRACSQVPADLFVPWNLTTPLDLGRTFDLVMSLEVAEHLPQAAAETFVSSLVGLGPVVLFSAAIPGQQGDHHVNLQWQDWWVEYFERHGYVPVDAVRPEVWGCSTTSSPGTPRTRSSSSTGPGSASTRGWKRRAATLAVTS